jgi:ethanolamine utilization protein EutA
MAHDAPWEHDHDVADPKGGHDDAVMWTTVGFDVGSSTSQVVFSRMTLSRRDSHYVVTERAVLHESEVILTPYGAPDRIDGHALAVFIDRQFAQAGLSRADVDTGSVILTGLALLADNSRVIADAIADESGRFVAVSAGDMLEARLAANGADAPARSREIDGVLAHIDVGGGTTKLSAWRAGRLLGLAAIDVGARLVTFESDGAVRRAEPPAIAAAARAGMSLPVSADDQAGVQGLAQVMALDVLRHAGLLHDAAANPDALRTASLFEGDPPPVAAVLFSGGVSEYVYGRETRTFQDLGLPLGRALREGVETLGIPILPFERGIRATVLGVSQHSVQLSGNTVWVSDDTVLPLRNIPVLFPSLDLAAETLDRAAISAAIQRTVRASGEVHAWSALAVNWKGSATFDRLDALARGILDGLQAQSQPDAPLLVVVEGDVAGVLGARLQDRAGPDRMIVCLDGIHVHDFDHIDVGAFAAKTRALPVVIKTLLFSASLTKKKTAHEHAHADA